MCCLLAVGLESALLFSGDKVDKIMPGKLVSRAEVTVVAEI